MSKPNRGENSRKIPASGKSPKKPGSGNGTLARKTASRKRGNGNGKTKVIIEKHSCKLCSQEALKAQPDYPLILACVEQCSKGCQLTVACAQQTNGGFATRRKTRCFDATSKCAVLRHGSGRKFQEQLLEDTGAYLV